VKCVLGKGQHTFTCAGKATSFILSPPKRVHMRTCFLLGSLGLKRYVRFQKDGTVLNFLTLDKKGIALALLFGAMILFFGGNYGPFFLFDMVVFLVLSAIATWIGRLKKEKMGTYEKSRGWRNVLANGLIPVAISLVYFLNHSYGTFPGAFIAISYVASVAAIAADKFASEIGVLDGTPVMLLTFKKVKKGTSGGVTLFGLAMSFVAALIIGISAFYLTGTANTGGTAVPSVNSPAL